jgi:hypothetical protein
MVNLPNKGELAATVQLDSFTMGENVMRTIAFAFASVLTVCVSAPVSAAQLPTDSQCHAIARERGAGETSGSRNHERFIAQCLAGRIPLGEVPGIPTAVRDLRERSSDACHELARQRGAGETSGNRNHERFIRDCMAGKVSSGAVRIATQELRKRSEAECDALSRQRGSGEASGGNRNHERFVRACMAGKVS